MILLLWGALNTAPAVAPAALAAETGFIRVMDLTMRSGPGKTTRPIKTLERGALVSVLGRRDGWLKVRHDGHTGYILNDTDYVRLIGETTKTPPDEGAPVSLQKNTENQGAGDDSGRQGTGGRNDARVRSEIVAEIQRSNEELTDLRNRATKLVDAVDLVEREVNLKRRQLMASEAELGDLEERIQMERAQLAEIETRVADNSRYAGQRLRALYQLSRLGTLPVLANADSWMDFLQRKTALSRVLAADRVVLDELDADRKSRADLLTELHKRREERQQLEQALKAELGALAHGLTERKSMLAEIKAKAVLQKTLIQGLEASAKDLDATIRRLAVPGAAHPQSQAKASKSEVKLKPPPAPAASEPNTARGVQPFEKLKGLLNFPVSGKIISSYGHYRNVEFNVMNFRSGVLIRADRGEPIHAVANGTALFADWFKGYGNMLIIDHGDHYYTVYAHLEALFKARGDSVDADEVIATVGDTATLAGAGLHFEVRHHGKPVDPLPWLRDSDRAASDRKKGVDG